MIKYSFLILTFVSVQLSFAQAFSFRSTNALPIKSNPAFAGTGKSPRLNYAIGITNVSFTTYSLNNYVSYDQAVNVLHGGVGIEIQHGNILRYQNSKTGIKLNYSFQQNLSDKLTLSIGARASFSQQRMNVNEFYNIVNSEDSILTTNQSNFSLGGLIYAEHFFVGAVYLPYTFENANGEIELINGFNTTAGYNFSPFKNKQLSFTPVVHYSFINGFQNLILQASFNMKRLAVGASVSPRSYATIFAGYQFDKFSIKAITGFNNSPLSNASQTSQELIFQYNFPNGKNKARESFNLNLF
jgi:type IX secretion system PorP/SprF family membrane protein